MKQPLVAIKCLVYNHEPYLRDCLEGFVMQQTNFPFVAIVHDDASTDSSAAIIREYEEKYPDIIKPIYETENQYSKRNGSLGRIMNAAIDATGAKYVAICEGDDYWIDPLKLQKQVDFMEANPECGLVFTNHECDKNGVVFNVKSLIDNITFENLVLANTIVTCSVLYRRDMYITLVSDFLAIIRVNKLLMGDYPLWLLFAEKSQIKKIDCVSARYRLLEESASHSKNKRKSYRFDKSTLLCKKIFYERLRKRNDIRSIYQVIFYEMEFHARKRMLFDYGYIAFDQIFYLLKLLPLYPIIIYRSIRRKLVRENREYRENIS